MDNFELSKNVPRRTENLALLHFFPFTLLISKTTFWLASNGAYYSYIVDVVKLEATLVLSEDSTFHIPCLDRIILQNL